MKSKRNRFNVKVWLNSIYFKTQQNQNLKSKFFKYFEFFIYLLLLTQNIKNELIKLNWKKIKFNISNNNKYTIKKISNNIFYFKNLKTESL